MLFESTSTIDEYLPRVRRTTKGMRHPKKLKISRQKRVRAGMQRMRTSGVGQRVWCTRWRWGCRQSLGGSDVAEVQTGHIQKLALSASACVMPRHRKWYQSSQVSQ